MQLGTPEIISKSQRERLIVSNIAFMSAVRLFGTVFLNETENKTYYCSISLNVKSRKRYLNLKKN